MSVTCEQIVERISYCPTVGVFRWRNGPRCGREAGTISDGYRVINLGGKPILAHRMAWFLHTGEWPDGPIDHINRDRDDNRIVNLRVVSAAENNRNRVFKRRSK